MGAKDNESSKKGSKVTRGKNLLSRKDSEEKQRKTGMKRKNP